MEIVCAVCKQPFEAQRSSAKYCGDTCRQRKRRGAKAPSPGGLVASVEGDLTAAGVIDTYPGQLAVELARQMVASGATGIASLSKELRTVMAAALAGVIPAAAAADEVDEVARVRAARESKARAAAG